MAFKRYTKINENTKILNLHKIEWEVYRYLQNEYEKNPNRWISKEELMSVFPELQTSSSHDKCARINSIRLWLLEAKRRGMISNIVLLKSNKLKIASDKNELIEQADKERVNGIKKMVRSSIIRGSLIVDGQGRLLNRNGEIIDENSLAKKWESLFEV